MKRLNHHPARALWLCLASASAVIIFYPAGVALFRRWLEPVSYFDHAIFVPFVCAWMTYRERETKSSVAPIGAPVAGIGLLLLALLLQLLGVAQQITFVQGLALVLTIWATVLFFIGRAGFRRYRWPALYLLLLIPIPSFFMAQMTLGMREMSTNFASSILQGVMALFNEPFSRVGNVLSFAGHRVTIVDACSGMNTLLTVIAVGLILVYLEKSRTNAWLTASLLIPVAILANLIRILTLCFFVNLNMEKFAFGEGHVPIGLFTVGAAFAILAFGVRAPRRFKEKWDRSVGEKQEISAPQIEVSQNKFLLPIYSVIFIVAAFASFTTQAARPSSVSSQNGASSELVPKQTLPDWQATEVPMDPTTYDVVGTKDAHMYQYNPSGHRSDNPPDNPSGNPSVKPNFKKPIYVYWLRSESSRKIGHPPELCYRGENYEIVERTETSIHVRGREIPIIRLIAERGNYKLLVYYWYRIGGVETASYLEHQFEWAWNHIKHFNFSAEINEASMTRLSTQDDGDGEAEKRLKNWMEENQ